MTQKTIAAISTPIGTGGISIVRISGEHALDIALKLINKTIAQIKPRQMHLVSIKTKHFTEKGLLVFFQNPNSYTGEDLVEIQCHGGVVIARGILDELLNHGANLAEDGEFTKRAFLNGKLTLEAAEGVIDMINAQSEAQVRAGYNLLKGELFKQVQQMQNNLTDTLAQLEVAIDYPEHDIEYETIENFKQKLLEVKNQITALLQTAQTGKLIKDGINVAIVGKPNVGKSSLMNALLNFDRAIVTDIEGTTRDTLEESYVYKGVKINLIDTAGIRNSVDLVEKLGIDRAVKTLEYADVVLNVLDGSQTLSEQDKHNLLLSKDKVRILVQNKLDKSDKPIVQNEEVIMVSALNRTNIELLKETIFNKVIDKNIFSSSVLITSKRHEQALSAALESTNQALLSIDNAMSLDLVAIDIQNAWHTLGEITGQTSTEEIVDAIFTKFCLGK